MKVIYAFLAQVCVIVAIDFKIYWVFAIALGFTLSCLDTIINDK